MAITEDRVRALFPDAKRVGDRWMVCCPAHDDTTASASIREGDNGKALVCCHAGCSNAAIAKAVHLTERVLYRQLAGTRRRVRMGKATTTRYVYADAEGDPLYRVVRTDRPDGRKTFRQERYDNGSWRAGMDGVSRVPYRLKRLAGKTRVYWVEGEKCADRLVAEGCCATTACGGAGGFKPEHRYAEQLQACGVRTVVVLPDHDAPGQAYADTVARACLAVGLRVKAVALPGLSEKGDDIVDWLARGQTRDDLKALVKATPVFVPASAPTAEAEATFDQRLLAATPDAAMAILNERHFVIRAGSGYVVADERPNEPLRLLPFAEFKKRYLPMDGLADRWLKSSAHRFYDGDLVSKPPGCPVPVGPDDYNLAATVLAVDPTPGDWSKLRHHIEENLCRGDREKSEYFLNWCALLVQQPGRLPGVAICLQGDEGTGKGAMYRYLAALFAPQHVAQVTKREQLVGRFNAILSGRVLVFADEAFFAGDKSVIGALHGLITEPRQLIERKGIDCTFEEDNCVHLLIASNEEWVLHAGKHARRYLVLDVSDKHMQDTTYFNAITHQQNHGGREAFLDHLLSRDVRPESFNPYNVPKTEALLDQIDRSRPPHEQWWKEQLTEATEGTWQEVQSKKGLHAVYLAWTERHHIPRPQTLDTLGKFFKKTYGLGVSRRVRSEQGGLRPRMFVFPDLATCRERFDARGHWPEEEGRRRIRLVAT
jgi:hypothetical protein